MSCSTLIGPTASGGTYAARMLRNSGDPEQMARLLRRIWQRTFERHTLALADTLLRHDWGRLHHVAWDAVWLPVARAGLDARICLAAHPNVATVLHATAHAVCAATAPTPGEAGRREPWLRQVRTEFDLVWPHGRGPHRLRRDADGLLPDVDVPDWSWWLLPTPNEGTSR